MKLFVIICILFFQPSLHGQTQEYFPAFDYTVRDILSNCHVKSVSAMTTKVDSVIPAAWEKKYRKEFDKDGRITEIMFYSLSGPVNPIRYHYNRDGKLIRKTTRLDTVTYKYYFDGDLYEEDSWNGIILNRSSYFYNKPNQIQYIRHSTIRYDQLDTTGMNKACFYYDKDDRLIHEMHISLRDTTYQCWYKYDGQNNLIEKRSKWSYLPDTSTTKLEYDSKNRIIRWLSLSKTGVPTTIITWEYDSSGLIMSRYDEKFTIITSKYKTKYEYEYYK
ncbi:hypothetical protein F9K33_16315 [bacterium]|nr:MAG: hypothetical protein F9K33_16315 [bacterium]